MRSADRLIVLLASVGIAAGCSNADHDEEGCDEAERVSVAPDMLSVSAFSYLQDELGMRLVDAGNGAGDLPSALLLELDGAEAPALLRSGGGTGGEASCADLAVFRVSTQDLTELTIENAGGQALSNGASSIIAFPEYASNRTFVEVPLDSADIEEIDSYVASQPRLPLRAIVLFDDPIVPAGIPYVRIVAADGTVFQNEEQ